MDGVEGINLNGTDYEVQDKTARNAQSALDERVDNITTVIEEQVQPVVDTVEELQEQANQMAEQIEQIPEPQAGVTFTKVYEDEENKSTGTITIANVSAKTRGYLIEFRVSANQGYKIEWVSIATNQTPVTPLNTYFMECAGDTSGGNTATYYRRRIYFNDLDQTGQRTITYEAGELRAYNASSWTQNRSDIMVPLRIWRIDDGE